MIKKVRSLLRLTFKPEYQRIIDTFNKFLPEFDLYPCHVPGFKYMAVCNKAVSHLSIGTKNNMVYPDTDPNLWIEKGETVYVTTIVDFVYTCYMKHIFVFGSSGELGIRYFNHVPEKQFDYSKEPLPDVDNTEEGMGIMGNEGEVIEEGEIDERERRHRRGQSLYRR